MTNVRHSRNRGWHGWAWPAVVVVALGLAGCGSPNRANILLRKENQKLAEQLAQVQAQDAADRARIAELEQQKGTLPTLPQTRLDQLFTARRIQIGRLTGPVSDKPPLEWQVYLTPLDENDDALKATGKVTIQAFDLNEQSGLRLGRWEWTAEQLKTFWRGLGPLHAYALPVRLSAVPQHATVTLKVTFRDELTGRSFTELKEVTIPIPEGPRTAPSTRP